MMLIVWLSATMIAEAQPSTPFPTYVTMTPTVSSLTPTSSPFVPTFSPASTTPAPSLSLTSDAPTPSFSATAVPTNTRSNITSSFVLGFMRNFGNPGVLLLFITGKSAGAGTVSVPGVAFFTGFEVTPGDITTLEVPSSATALQNDVIENLGIRVDATSEIVVYGLHHKDFMAGSFLGLPTNVLGTNYIVLGYSSGRGTLSLASAFLVVARDDNTVVTITPTLSSAGRVQGIPYTISLDALDTYQLLSEAGGEDVSGSVITSTKPVAVFGGGTCIFVPPTTRACDHVVEQLPPTDTWGTTFLTVPIALRIAGDVFRILARDSNTQVVIDGVVVATLNATSFFETELSSFTVHEIVTTKPCLVAQYSKGGEADDEDADPLEMLIPSIDQFVDSYTVTTPERSAIFFDYRRFVNVIVLTTDLDACQVDGQLFSSFYTDLGAIAIGTSAFTGAQLGFGLNFRPEVFNLNCPSPFGALVYGLGTFTGFGHPGGMALHTHVT